jgi:hypothetical protein
VPCKLLQGAKEALLLITVTEQSFLRKSDTQAAKWPELPAILFP